MRKRRFYMKERLCVEEQLFRADVEERLFRAVSASAFDCGLQPPASPKGHPSSRCRGHEWPLFHAHASSCAPGAKKHPDSRKTAAAQVRGDHPCLSNNWRNKVLGQPQSVTAAEKKGQPAAASEYSI